MQNTTGFSGKQKIGFITLGVFLSLILLEIGLQAGGFALSFQREHRNRIEMKKKNVYRIMCVGESTTATSSYPMLLQDRLNQLGKRKNFIVINKGTGGADTSYIMAHLKEGIRICKPDMVIAMMGINDSGPIVTYDIVKKSHETSCLKNFRTYRLMQLILLHIAAKNIPSEYRVNQAGFVQAEESSKETIFESLRKLGVLYQQEGKYSQAGRTFKKAIELSPEDAMLYSALGVVYRSDNKLFQAEEMFHKAIKLSPYDVNTYVELAWIYYNQGKFSQAEDMFKKSLQINPDNEMSYTGLGQIYANQGKISLAEDSFRKALECNPKNDRNSGRLAVICEENGQYELAKKYYNESCESRSARYNAMTMQNYQKMKQILDNKNIKLVCAQYPMRSVKPLKSMFEDRDGIIFVDNEKVFKDALRKGTYREYFLDMFGGEFGHCTARGDELLAENIAKSIAQQVQ